MTLDCPNDRYINDEAICQSLVPMLARVGIKVTLNAQTKSKHFDKILKMGKTKLQTAKKTAEKKTAAKAS